MLVLLWASAANATEVALAGLVGERAIIVVEGGRRHTLSVGGPAVAGVRLIAVEPGAAVVDIDGKRRRLQLGQSVVSAAKAERTALTLSADGQGHFYTTGRINGAPVRFIVDTGATLVSLGAQDARRARIDTAHATPALTMTANGMARVWRVRLPTLQLGDITLHDVDASVHEHDMPVALLGMSVLNRMEMRREGSTLTLIPRY